ncbi:hypothetical protein [Roseateles sp.]|uniref:PilW family protein n=1 Tax=Roseateles sp. TaxID=1971397 RepID=UPI0025E87925|nr:hypothetical protein [Roseateles sp.]
MNLHLRRASRGLAERGLGLVELMVGITVGLIVVAGATLVATRQITEHRRLMLEVQMQQDLRVAADLLQQDLRRAGYRGLPANGVWEPERSAGTIPAKPAASSPYTVLTQPQGTNDLLYRYARPPAGTTAVNTSNALASNEQSGIRLSNKTLYLQLGQSNWQPITDPDAVLIENFTPVISTQQISLEDVCDCTTGGACPTLTLRRVDVTIQAVSKSDRNVKRTLRVSEKIRADLVDGVCQ